MHQHIHLLFCVYFFFFEDNSMIAKCLLSTYSLGERSPTEDAFGAANVVVGGAPAARVEPLYRAARVVRVLPVQQHQLLLGANLDRLHLLLQLCGRTVQNHCQVGLLVRVLLQVLTKIS